MAFTFTFLDVILVQIWRKILVDWRIWRKKKKDWSADLHIPIHPHVIADTIFVRKEMNRTKSYASSTSTEMSWVKKSLYNEKYCTIYVSGYKLKTLRLCLHMWYSGCNLRLCFILLRRKRLERSFVSTNLCQFVGTNKANSLMIFKQEKSWNQRKLSRIRNCREALHKNASS